MSQVKQKANNTDNLIERIISFLHGLDYSNDEFKDSICLPLAQWLCDEGFSIEDTGLIITSVANIDNATLESVYDENTPALVDKSDLMSVLSQEEFEDLEKLIKPPVKSTSITIDLDDSTSVKVDFINKRVFHVQNGFDKNGNPTLIEKGVIEAVPYELVIYDSDFSETTRTFKITWKSKYSKRLFITQSENGATIKDIETMLVEGGYTHNRKLLIDVLSAMINVMVRDNLAIIKDDIDTKGVYYHDNKVLVVKLDTKKPTVSELKDTVKILDKLHEWYTNESATLATVLKWSLVCIFSFARKQAGTKWLPWLYLAGTGQSGKTTIAKIGSFFYGEPYEEMNIGGSSFNSDYRIGVAISRDCSLTIVNEPKATFNNEDTVETVKNSVELKICRKVHSKTYYAFSPVIFTSNGFIPEMDSLYRRLFIIDFNYNQRKSKSESDEFEDLFNVENPARSCLRKLEAFGRVALNEIIKNPELLFDDWMTLADYLIEQCYIQAEATMPDWLKTWSEDKELEDLDNIIIDEIQAIVSNELYKARKVKDAYSDYSDGIPRKSKDFEHVYWSLLNEGAFNWALPHQPWGNSKNIFLTQGFKKLLKNNGVEEAGTLKSIAEMLGWEYKRVRFGKKDKKGILVPFDVFIEFAYPSVE